MHHKKSIITLLGTVVLTSFLLISPQAKAETSQQKGLTIAQEKDRRDLGWKDSAVDMTMQLRNRGGETSHRKMRREALEVIQSGSGDKSLVIFKQPNDIKGTAFLSHTKINKADNQWLYLPALKRVKRISSANKSGPFVGSEFAYEDLLSDEVAKYTYNWLRDEACVNLQCFVLERFPVYKNSGYSRQLAWIDKTHYRLMKIEFYDRKKDLLKTLVYKNYKQYLGKYWRAQIMEMKNHQTGKSTLLTFNPYRFQTGLNDRSFTTARLKRAH